ncbi:aquaporin-9 isoform 2-T2 [Mantella aurantiaca]
MGIQSLQRKMLETDNSKDSRRSSKYSTIAMQEDRSCLSKLKLRNSLAKETLSEFFGTCLLITLGCSCVASSVLSNGKTGGYLTNNLGFAMAVTMAIYATGGVSGRLEWVKLPFYVSAQLLGAITGSALVFGVYYDALIKYTSGVLTVYGPNATAHIFATYPSPYLSTINGLADQMLSTALLLILVFAIFDKKNIAAPKGLEPIAVGLLILLLGLSLGTNCGGAMNPARDLGPRIFTAAAGWGYDVFTAGNNFWWIPVVGPMAGGALGAYIYILCIEAHHHNGQESLTHDVETDQFEKHELASMA